MATKNLVLNPANDIVFEGPFKHVVTSYLELHNPDTEKKACFKIKTTAPRRYCVRPNSGFIQPGQTQKIAIMLQPLDSGFDSETAKHKFMVQSTTEFDQTLTSPEAVWLDIIATDVKNDKLKCVFRSNAPNADVESTTACSSDIVAEKSTSGDTKANLSETPIHQVNKPTDTPENRSNMNLFTTSSVSDKSRLESSQNLSSFQKTIQSGDYTSVYIAILMLVLGIIFGKYLL